MVRCVSRRLDGKVALITGGGTGIGAATARRFAAEGASVVVTGRRPQPIEQVAREIGGLALAGDTADSEWADAAIAATVEKFHRLDIVIANAGAVGNDELRTADDARWQRVLDTNLSGAMKIGRAALPAMIDGGGGSIVNVSSVAGLLASPRTLSYGVSKSAMIGLTRSMAYDYGPYGVRVNTLCPGWVRTPMSEQELDELAARRSGTRDDAFRAVTAYLPLRRAAEPEEVASCCLFLASDEASFVTGAVLVADGGGAIVDVGTLAFAETG